MRLPLCLLLAIALAGCCATPSKKPDTTEFPWEIPSRAWFLAKIPPPPAPGSAAARRDLDTVLALQAKSTPAKIARAKESYDLTVFTFGPAIAPQIAVHPGSMETFASSDFNAARYPKTAAFFKQLNDLVNSVNDYVKDAYKRPHPFQVSDKVRRIVIAKPGYSYPSYHSARCVVFQRVLEQLDPGHEAGLAAISLQVEEDRVFAGEHFPSDIRGGIRLGKLIWAALEKDANFRAGVEALKKAEWTPPPGVTWDRFR